MAEPLKSFSERMAARKEQAILRDGRIEDDSKRFREKVRRDLEAAGIKVKEE